MKTKITSNVGVELFPVLPPDSIRARVITSRGESAEMIDIFLKDLDEYALDAIAREFADGLFKAAGKSAPPQCAPEPRRPDVAAMVNRFLSWKLPSDFAPDCHISFQLPDPVLNPNPTWPIGTNLFTADQARQMIEYLLSE